MTAVVTDAVPVATDTVILDVAADTTVPVAADTTVIANVAADGAVVTQDPAPLGADPVAGVA
jgi:hypothetical protein